MLRCFFFRCFRCCQVFFFSFPGVLGVLGFQVLGVFPGVFQGVKIVFKVFFDGIRKVCSRKFPLVTSVLQLFSRVSFFLKQFPQC